MSAQSTIISIYGLPNDAYREKHCIVWNVIEDFKWAEDIVIGGTQLHWKDCYINSLFKSKLYNVFKKLEAKGLHKEIKTFDGCFVKRNVRGRNRPSLHSWAMAIDFNSQTETLNQKKNGQFYSNFSPAFINCFTSEGIYWGGNWKSRFDPMHFALYNG